MKTSKSSCLAVVLSLSALGVACAADQSRAPDTANNRPGSDMTLGHSQPPLADTTPKPSTEPATLPPAAPPSGTNELAASGTGTPLSAPALSEAQVARITELAHSAEVEQGKLAQTKAKSAAVKKFAALLVKHHSDAKLEQSKLYKDLGLTPTQSQQGTQLKEDADRTLGALRAADGSNFDVEFVNAQVAAHQMVLDTINQELLPAAADQRLVDSLNKMKNGVETHLNEARSLQAELSRTSPAGTSTTPAPSR